MKLVMLRTATGEVNLSEFLVETRLAGFDGIEGPIPANPAARKELRQQLQDNGLVLIAESTTGSDLTASDWWIPRPERTVPDHLQDLRLVAERAVEVGALFVNTMCGRDSWAWSEQVDFFGEALELEQQIGIPISFETHRSRSLFNPWITRDLLQIFPAMQITCDFSHWCVVCERLLDSEWPILELCAQRTLHVQCRVGYAQHAQVSDPRAPEFQEALLAHERWWDLIWQSQLQRGFSQVTMTPEFLYDGYMQLLPYTGAPVADVWEINCWMAQRQRQRFVQQYSAG